MHLASSFPHLGLLPPPSMTSHRKGLQQSEISGASESATASYFGPNNVAEFESAIRREGSTTWALAIGTPSSEGVIKTIALATDHAVFHFTLPDSASYARSRPLKSLFTDVSKTFVAFEAAHLGILLHGAIGGPVTIADLSTVVVPGKDRGFARIGALLALRNHPTSLRQIEARWEERDEDGEVNICVRAWFTALATGILEDRLDTAKLITTKYLKHAERECLALMVARTRILEHMKPLVKETDFKQVEFDDGKLVVNNARFKTRVRRSEQTSIEMVTSSGMTLLGTAKKSEGRRTWIQPDQDSRGAPIIERIRIHGREESTTAEQEQYRFVMHALMREDAGLRVSFFSEVLWFPGTRRRVEREFYQRTKSNGAGLKARFSPEANSLNEAQTEVLAAMLSESERSSLVIVHGPPGTGKTSTISSAMSVWRKHGQPAWVIAQSNVGVKNIAEHLYKKGVDFKLVVSKEFYVEWHEDIYEKIKHNIIRSDEIPPDPQSVANLFNDTTVILCTLSMVSNPILKQCDLFERVPFERLVIDEASQIDVFEFMHLFYMFRYTLQKVVFFGDPKQLPPYGAEKANLSTIYDMAHLKQASYFLNTQYRMPVPLGNFISSEVYNDKLVSQHRTKDASCIAFVDVSKGQEEASGKSWKNMEEVHTVVRLVRQYHDARENFCVITPYDPQRSAIARQLAAEGLPSGCVFNVDSFQGNEADYVVLSLVRTAAPGFLSSLHRMNVGFTRCRQGMVLVTNKRFAHTSGASTLLGKLAARWQTLKPGDVWTDWRLVADRRVNLPGITARAGAAPEAPPASQIRYTLNPRPAPATILGGPPPQAAPARAPTRISPFPPLSLSTSASLARPDSAPSRTSWGQPHAAAFFSSSRASKPAAAPPSKPKRAEMTGRRTNFPALGEDIDEEAPRARMLQGRWRNGSEPVKACNPQPEWSDGW